MNLLAVIRTEMELKQFTNLPLGETEVHLSAALRCEAGLFLERAAHGAGGDGQVAVVAKVRVSIELRGMPWIHTSNRRLSRQQSF